MKHEEAPTDGGFDRLYTPWRMNYVKGERSGSGCVFCSMRESDDDAGNLILARGQHSYVVMNLFPYNTGHLLIVPNDHVGSPEDLSIEALHESAEFLPRALKAARTALGPDAFNVGFNLGSDAGAGIAAHLHQHVVPRWRGDANFMPIIGGTKVLPEVLPVTWAKLRAEFLRDRTDTFQLVLFDRLRNRVSIVDGTLPRISPEDGVPVWKTALDVAALAGAHARFSNVSISPTGSVLLLESESIDPDHDGAHWVPFQDVAALIPDGFGQIT